MKHVAAMVFLSAVLSAPLSGQDSPFMGTCYFRVTVNESERNSPQVYYWSQWETLPNTSDPGQDQQRFWDYVKAQYGIKNLDNVICAGTIHRLNSLEAAISSVRQATSNSGRSISHVRTNFRFYNLAPIQPTAASSKPPQGSASPGSPSPSTGQKADEPWRPSEVGKPNLGNQSTTSAATEVIGLIGTIMSNRAAEQERQSEQQEAAERLRLEGSLAQMRADQERLVAQKAAEQQEAERRAAEQRAAEQRAAEQRAAEQAADRMLSDGYEKLMVAEKTKKVEDYEAALTLVTKSDEVKPTSYGKLLRAQTAGRLITFMAFGGALRNCLGAGKAMGYLEVLEAMLPSTSADYPKESDDLRSVGIQFRPLLTSSKQSCK